MARSTGYRWDAPQPTPGLSFRPPATAWDLRWWILAAVGASITVHAGLFIWMKSQRMAAGTESEIIRQTGVFETDLEQISIPQEVLKHLDAVPSEPVPDTSTEAVVKDLPDITEIAPELRDKAFILTPAIKDQAENLTLSRPKPGDAGGLLDEPGKTSASLDIDLNKSLLTGSSSMTPSPMKPADDQMVIDAGVLKGSDLKGNIVTNSKKGAGNGGLDGFKSLDDLVNYQSPIAGDFKTMLRTDLLFDFGSAELRSDARLSLMKLGMIIQTNSGAEFRLVGHTDTIGDEPSNQKLSEARARAVKDWLVGSLRLDGSRIIVEGRGEREPLPGVNLRGDAAAQQLNRRVEIHKTGG